MLFPLRGDLDLHLGGQEGLEEFRELLLVGGRQPVADQLCQLLPAAAGEVEVELIELLDHGLLELVQPPPSLGLEFRRRLLGFRILLSLPVEQDGLRVAHVELLKEVPPHRGVAFVEGPGREDRLGDVGLDLLVVDRHLFPPLGGDLEVPGGGLLPDGDDAVGGLLRSGRGGGGQGDSEDDGPGNGVHGSPIQ